MISLKQLRHNPEEYGDRISLKGDDVNISFVLTLDEKVRSLKHQINKIRSERNRASEAIGLAKQNNEDASEAIEKTRELGHTLKKEHRGALFVGTIQLGLQKHEESVSE